MARETSPQQRTVIDGNPTAHHYGRSYWIVQLASGGWVSLHADYVVNEGGGLFFFGRSYEPNAAAGTGPDRDKPKGAEFMVMGFAAGQWTTFYAAKVLDGAPLTVDRWVASD